MLRRKYSLRGGALDRKLGWLLEYGTVEQRVDLSTFYYYYYYCFPHKDFLFLSCDGGRGFNHHAL